jgi:hypothetical protein
LQCVGRCTWGWEQRKPITGALEVLLSPFSTQVRTARRHRWGSQGSPLSIRWAVKWGGGCQKFWEST